MFNIGRHSPLAIPITGLALLYNILLLLLLLLFQTNMKCMELY